MTADKGFADRRLLRSQEEKSDRLFEWPTAAGHDGEERAGLLDISK
jgi:hypothetical protein